jgi:hypothetical protein
MMKKHHFTLTPVSYYLVVSSVCLLVIFYLFRIITSLSAFAYHQKFLGIISQREVATITENQHNSVTASLKNAIRYDSNNPKYHYELGSYLHQYHAESKSQEVQATKKKGFQEAEAYFKTAVMLDPGNPWYYYELGRLDSTKGECFGKQNARFLENPEECSTARYFLTALKKSPYRLFLRRVVGGWYYQYNPKNAFPIIRDIISRDAERTLNPQETALEFSEFLYEIHFDYESDLQYQKAKSDIYSVEQCCMINIIQSPERSKKEEQNLKEIELGNDDGSSEWRTFLASDQVRVKKVICLPENIADYNSAALKILMNNGGSGSFVALININNHLIKQYDHTDPVPRNVAWYEIPFDKALLLGKSSINVYIRVRGATLKDNFLQIRGDRDTSIKHSVFNFGIDDDLSFDEGIQTGEYMIRLVLRK